MRARPLQGLHLDAEAERLPLDPHDDGRSRRQRVELQIRTGEMHRRSPNTASPRTPSTRIWAAVSPHFGGHAISKDTNAYAWLRRTIEIAGRGRQPRGVPREHQARALPRPGLLLHAEGPADRAAKGRHPHRLRLCRPHRGRRTPASAQDQRPHHAADDASSRAATRSTSSARKAQVPPAAWENDRWSPARRARPIRRATRERHPQAVCRPRHAYPGARLRARRQDLRQGGCSSPRCTGSPSKDVEDVLASVGRGEFASADVRQGTSSPTTRTSAPRRRRNRARTAG
jgi:guanosine-3',5'-bis(diphosphate) 3'-pyrophosphohydrolase